MLNRIINVKYNTWNHLTASKQMSLDLLKDFINKKCLQIMYI